MGGAGGKLCIFELLAKGDLETNHSRELKKNWRILDEKNLMKLENSTSAVINPILQCGQLD